MPISNLDMPRTLPAMSTIWLSAAWLGVLGLALFVLTSHRWQILSSHRRWQSVVAVSLAGVLLVMVLGRHRFWPMVGKKELWIGVAGGWLALFCWCDVIFRFINCGLDRAPAIQEVTTMLDRGQYKTERHVTVDSPSIGGPVEIMVPVSVYNQLSRGAALSLTLHPGVLGAWWCDSNAVQPLAR